jgi:endothelin-converting enzyme
MQLSPAGQSTDELNFNKLSSAYNACLDEDAIQKIGLRPLTEVIDQVKKSFPLGGSSAGRSTNAISKTVLLLAKYGVSALVAPGTGADDTDPDTVVVSVSPPWTFGLPAKERYEDDALVKKYQGVLVDVLSKVDPDQDKEALEGVVDLEKKLAAASPSSEDRQDVTVRLSIVHRKGMLEN